MKKILVIFSVLLFSSCSKNQNGIETIYDEDGNLEVISIPVKNQPYDNLGITFHKNGNPKSVGHFKNGKLHGTKMKYSSEGQLNEKSNYINDKQNGIYEWYENGIILVRNLYKDDKIVSSLGLTKTGDTLGFSNEGKSTDYFVKSGLIKSVTCLNGENTIGKIEFDSLGKIKNRQGELPCLTKKDPIKLGWK